VAEEATSPRAPKGVVFRRPATEGHAVVEEAVADVAAVPVSSGVPGAELPMGSALSAELDSIQADIAARPLPVPARLEEEAVEAAALNSLDAAPDQEAQTSPDADAAGDIEDFLGRDLTPGIDNAGATDSLAPGVQVPPLIRAARDEPDSGQPPPLGLEELVHRFGEMMWLEARLYEVVGYWGTIEENNDVAVLFAEISRHHGWHAELWASAMPDVETFDTNLAVRPPHNGWVEFFQTLVEMKEPDQTADRVAALALVADPWVRIRNEQLSAAANAVSDRAIQRIQRFVLIDHDEDHERLIKALTYLPGGPVSDVAERLFPLIGESQ